MVLRETRSMRGFEFLLGNVQVKEEVNRGLLNGAVDTSDYEGVCVCGGGGEEYSIQELEGGG